MTFWATVLAGAVLAFVVAWRLAGRFSEPGSALYLADEPNERSLHARTTSRSGGLALLAGLALGLLMVIPVGSMGAATLYCLGAALAVGGVSLFDDCRSLPASVRLLVHFGAATVAVVGGGLSLAHIEVAGAFWPLPDWLGAGVSILLVVWFINLYNFMDGMDGFSGSMTVFGFGTLAVLFAGSGDVLLAAVCVVVVGACGGFLVVNWPPARIFMGDAGASLLGMLAALMCLVSDRNDDFPLWIGLLAFSPFVVDATFTLMWRAAHFQPVWRAHRDHCYQRLVQAGWGHSRTLRWAWALMLACALSAWLAASASAPVQAMVVAAWSVAYAGIVLMVYRLEGNAR